MEERTAQYFVEQYGMQAHPEGGWYKETYRADEAIQQAHLPVRFKGDRSFSTAIYFLLEDEQFSAFHRIQSDELWHFYYGGALNVYVIHDSGLMEIIRLGNNPDRGEVFQAVVKAGCWFASKPAKADTFSLVGCTVAPGFDFADFEMAEREALIRQYPQHKEVISLLTRE